MTGAVLLWVIPQMAALCIGAFRVPLTGGYASPAESAAAAVMVSVQVIAAAALFPVVLADWRRLIMAVAMAWAFGLLAGFLATTATLPLMLAMGQVTAWLVALWAWAGVVAASARGTQESPGKWAGVAVAAAMLLTVGGVMLGYLQREYQPIGPGGGSRAWEITPLMISVRQLGETAVQWTGWAVMAVLAAAGGAGRWLRG